MEVSKATNIFSHLELVLLATDQSLRVTNDDVGHAYFPLSGMVSLVYLMKNGASCEMSVVGNEGMVGLSIILAGRAPTGGYRVTGRGYAYRIPGHVLRREFDRSPIMQNLLLRYTQAAMSGMAQMAVCNRYHSLESQLCRWLLMAMDRMESESIAMTHEAIANLLGVRREAVTGAAGKLQTCGAISYLRGKIIVRSRAELEKRSCECYRVCCTEHARILNSDKLTSASGLRRNNSVTD